MLYVILRVHWCDIILNVHTPNEDESDDIKDSFYIEIKSRLNWECLLPFCSESFVFSFLSEKD
jgi:hypothetical protein